ncbi:hypothetical protein QIH52_27070, partial [Klebsiella pneumoniae]|nr:hypothetical protein [Klebsiella pneumoniae]
DDVKNSWNQARPDLGISKRITAASQEYTGLLGQLSAADAGDPSAYGVLVKQRQDFEDKLKGFDKKRETLTQHQKS